MCGYSNRVWDTEVTANVLTSLYSWLTRTFTNKFNVKAEGLLCGFLSFRNSLTTCFLYKMTLQIRNAASPILTCALAHCRNIADFFFGHDLHVTGYSDRESAWLSTIHATAAVCLHVATYKLSWPSAVLSTGAPSPYHWPSRSSISLQGFRPRDLFLPH